MLDSSPYKMSLLAYVDNATGQIVSIAQLLLGFEAFPTPCSPTYRTLQRRAVCLSIGRQLVFRASTT